MLSSSALGPSRQVAISSVAGKDGQGTSLALLGAQHVESATTRERVPMSHCSPFSTVLEGAYGHTASSPHLAQPCTSPVASPQS